MDLAWLLGNTQSLDSLPKICPAATHKAPCLALAKRTALSQRGRMAHAERKGISSDRLQTRMGRGPVAENAPAAHDGSHPVLGQAR